MMRSRPLIPALLLLGLTVCCGCGGENGTESDSVTVDTSEGDADGKPDGTKGKKTDDGEGADGESGGAPGTLTGTVTFEGDVPPPRIIQVTKNREVCAPAAGEVQDVHVAEDGALADVVVELANVEKPEGSWSWDEPDGGYVIRQKTCRFRPHVLVAHHGAELSVYNDDPIEHNINTGQWNVVQSPGEQPYEAQIRYAGRPFIRVTCNIHNWMEAWVYVARSTFYAKTGPEGRFTIADVPPGKYSATATHPTLGRQRFTVEIAPGGTAEQEIVFQ